MGKAKNIGLGLDIGTSSVKMVELERGVKGTAMVSRFAKIPLPPGALNGGVVSNGREVSQAIAELLQLTKIKQKKAAVAIAGQAVIVRHIKMPLMSEEELQNAIRWEAERYIPFPVDEVNMDCQIIETFPESNEMEVMLVCAHNDIVYSHLQTLEDSGIQPVAMDIQPFAVMRAMGLEDSNSDDTVALLDIGAGTADLTIIKKGMHRFTRIIPMAGSHMTTSVANHMNLDFNEAEKLKIAHGDALFDVNASSDDVRRKVNFALQNCLKELALELRRSFDYYKMQQRNETIKELVVSGGGSKIVNLIPFLRQELNIVVKSAFYHDEVDCPEKLRSEFEEMFPILTVALGLALREVTDK